MPSFIPTRPVNHAALGVVRNRVGVPNVFMLNDGQIVEGGNPHESTVHKSFMVGHEPVGVSDHEAKLLIDAGYHLRPDSITAHSLQRYGKSFALTLMVPDSDYARGCKSFAEAYADCTVIVDGNIDYMRRVPWFFRDKTIEFGYILNDNVDHRIEIVLRNEIIALDPYVVEHWIA